MYQSNFSAPPPNATQINDYNVNQWNNSNVLVPPYPPPPLPSQYQNYSQPPPQVNGYAQNYNSTNSYSSNYSQQTHNFQYSYSNEYYQGYENYSTYNCPPPDYTYNNGNSNYSSSTSYTNNSTSFSYKEELESYKNLQGNCAQTFDKVEESLSYKHRYSNGRKYNNVNKNQAEYTKTNFKRRSRSNSPDRRYKSRDFRDGSSRRSVLHKSKSERDAILTKWRENYCATREEVCNRIKELAKINQDEVLEKEKNIWTRTTPADLFYEKDERKPRVTNATSKLLKVCEEFNENLVMRAKTVNERKPLYEPPPRKNRARLCKHKCKFV